MENRSKYYFKYRSSKGKAKRRGIPFELTYGQWLRIWILSGKLHKRGTYKGGYVMARFGDKGPYAVGNVKIITTEENTYEQSKEARDRISQSDRDRAYIFIDYKGKIMTISQAVEAAGNIVSRDLAKQRLRRGWPCCESLERPSEFLGKKIKYKAVKQGVCKVCGKLTTRRKVFYQSIDVDTSSEERDKILLELKAQAKEWKKGRAKHTKCEVK